jgi:hypothetical protein
MKNAGRLKISGKFPALKVELDGKMLPCESIALYLNAQEVPTAVVAFPLLEEVDIDIPALIETPED